MSTKSKYAIGDIVEFGGQRAKIIAVHEEDYFFGTENLYYMYDIEFFSDGTVQKGVTEAALQGIITPQAYKRICECGAWSVLWASDEHSRWCPASYYTQEKDKK